MNYNLPVSIYRFKSPSRFVEMKYGTVVLVSILLISLSPFSSTLNGYEGISHMTVFLFGISMGRASEINLYQVFLILLFLKYVSSVDKPFYSLKHKR